MIRQANENDINEVRELVMMASALVFEDILQTKDTDKLDELFNKLYLSKNNKFSFENTLVYEHKGKVAGCLVSYYTKDEPKLNINLEKISNTDYKAPIEGEPNCLYLDSLAVAKEYQGLGISRKLLEYIIEHSDTDLSLLVEIFKKDVKAYYERIGFKTIRTVKYFDGELDSMIYKK